MENGRVVTGEKSLPKASISLSPQTSSPGSSLKQLFKSNTSFPFFTASLQHSSQNQVQVTTIPTALLKKTESVLS